MDNVQRAIDLAAAVGAKVEDITFEEIRSNDNGASLWAVADQSSNGVRYIIEGETGELLSPVECSEEDAIAMWEAA
jgi:hypothetical protein